MSDLMSDRLVFAIEEELDRGSDASTIAFRLADEMRRGIGGNAPPADEAPGMESVDPTNLLRIPAADFQQFFDAQFGPLVARNAEIVQGGRRRQEAHSNGRSPIASEADYADVTEWLRVADDHIKEIAEAAEPVTQPLFQAHRAAVAWFKGLREYVEAVRGTGRNPALGTLQQMQTAWLVEKDRIARELQQRLQREAEERARAAREEADRRQREEEERIRQLQQVGVPEGEAAETIMAGTDRAIEEAERAAAIAADAARAAAVPVGQTSHTRDARGSSYLQQTWDFQIRSLGMLCLAIGAPKLADNDLQERIAVSASIGKPAVAAVCNALIGVLMPEGTPIPATFLSVQEGEIRKAIGRKQAPVRQIPGVEIIEGVAGRRRSA